MTPKQRLKIYKKMLELAIKDRKLSIEFDHSQHGLCTLLCDATYNKIHSNEIEDYPELMALKPKNKATGGYWWEITTNSMTRINKLKQIIATMTNNINH